MLRNGTSPILRGTRPARCLQLGSPMHSARLLVLALTLGISGLSACGGSPSNVVTPKDFTGKDALGGEAAVCKGKPSYARPFTIDLDDATRGDLEASMKTGLVVVAYDCTSLRVLDSCKAPHSDYEYARVGIKEETVQLKAMNDLKANLPIGAAKLSGEISAGRSIDLALVSIGRHSSARSKVAKTALTGDCDGATHVVTKAYLGAFSMATGSSGKMAAVAEMFSRGASASSSTERSGARTDGSLDACRAADEEATAPTPKCKTALRVELTPLVEGDKQTAVATTVGTKEDKRSIEVTENPCREGFRFSDGACVANESAPAKGFLCDPKNAEECTRECGKGNAGSCTNAGALAMKHFGNGWSWDKASGEALPLFKKACEAGDQNGCTGIIKATIVDEDSASAPAQISELVTIGKKACDAGVAAACQEVGTLTHPELHPGKKWADADTSAKYFERGCRLGDALACGAAGKVILAKDVTRGVALYQRGCDGGDADVCNALALGLIQGKRNIPKDVERGASLARQACEMNIEKCMTSASHLVEASKAEDGFRAAVRGCEDKDVRTHLDKDELASAKGRRGLACQYLGRLYTEGTGTTKDPAKAATAFKTACDIGEETACDELKTKPSAKPKPKSKAKPAKKK